MAPQGSPNPELDPFRQTRSGSAFSPWHSRIGTPLHVSEDFCIVTQVEKAFARYEQQFQDTLSSAPIPLDPDDLALEPLAQTTGQTHAFCASRDVVLLPSTSTSTSGMSRDPPGPPPGPPLPSTSTLRTPRESPGLPPRPSSPTMPISKYHKKQHSKAGRQRKRAAAKQLSSGQAVKISRGVKSCARGRILDAFKDASSRLGCVDVEALAHDVSSPALHPGDPIHTEYSLAFGDVSIASTAFIALDDDDDDGFDPLENPVEELQAQYGYTEVEWDGREFIPVLAASQHVLCSLVGQPDDENWDRDVNVALSELFEEFRGVYHLQGKERVHRRSGADSDFPAVSVGISYGGGQQRVGNLAHSPHNRTALAALLGSSPLRRVANFADFALRMTAPDLHNFYADTLEEVCNRDSGLSRNFPNNAFAAATLNLGPRTATRIHTDYYNHPCGMCAITALGDYDYKLRGQLVLKKLKLIIRFPPGSTILIPSALIPHGNIPIARHECQYSFTQYFAGGIFRWGECGHQTQRSFLSSGGQFKRTPRQRWEESVNRLCTWTQLKEHWGVD